MRKVNIPLEELAKGAGGSIYMLTILAAKRAIALADGDKSLLERADGKVLDNALKEIQEGKVKVKDNK